MPARALVPVETLPLHSPLSGPWAPPTGASDAPPTTGMGHAFCRSGPCPPLGPVARGGEARRVYQQGEAPLYIPPLIRQPPWNLATLL